MKKGLLLTCLLTLVAAFGMAQTQWPITLTTADGLPGVKGPKNYTFTSKKYDLGEAISTLRMTVCATLRTDANTTAYDGYSSGWGPGNPFFCLGEVKIFDGAGQPVDFVATSNAASTWDGGGLEAVNDGNFGSYFQSTWYQGPCPQDYHYLEFEFSQPISAFQIQWLTWINFLNEPSYVGLTPGTPYYPYPEQEFELGEKVTDVATLAEGGLYVIRDNAPEFWYGNDTNEDSYKRGEPYHNKAFYHAPNGGNLTANAASVVYFIPTGEENTYKMRWLNNGKFAAKQSTAAWVPWSDEEIDAAAITFTNSEESEGDFILTINNGEMIYLGDALGKMACTNNVDTILAKRSRPFDKNFSIYKASVNVAKIKSVVAATVADAKEYIALYGYNATEDKGEKAALESAISAAEALIASDATVTDLLAADNAVKAVLPAYVALAIYQYTDSIQTIVDAIEDEEILLSGAPNWVEGSYPEGSDATLRAAADAAYEIVDTYTCVADIDKAISEVIKAISAFWASKITGVMQLPFRVGTADGTPGAFESSTGYIWESPTYLLTEAISSLRFTVFHTNSAAKYGNYEFPTLAEFQLFDSYGNQITLTEENFKTNSICPTDGKGLAGLCDNDNGTYYHAAYGNGHDPNGYDGTQGYVYIEVTLPEAVSAFRYRQVGRVYSGTTRVNTPVDFVFGYAGVDATPETVPFPDPYNAVCGEKVTDVSQITDDGIYAIQGLISCDPVNHFDTGQQNPHFYSATKVYGELLQGPCAFSITKTGDADGSFYIQSLSNGKYWSAAIDDDGWGDATDTYYKEAAAKVLITPNNNDGLPNSFVLYQYIDTVKRNDQPHPYVVFQDWGSALATFSVPSLEDNDKDGEGEWYIFKMTMDNAYVYWLQNLITAAEALGLEKRPDPGYYADLGSFPEALQASQDAVAAGDNARCKELVAGLSAAIAEVQAVTPNPMVAGRYVIESGHPEFFATQGVHKAIFAYDNDLDTNLPESAYKLWWGDAPEGDYNKAMDIYKFDFESAANDENVLIALEDGLIDSIQAANAYYIKSVAYGQYVGAQDGNSKSLGFTETPETYYIVRQQVATIYDLWNPAGASFSFHAAGHSGGSGTNGNIVYWTGSDQPSWWRLRRVNDGTSIGGGVAVEGDEVVSVTYYTADGAAVAAPVKGINIVKTVYANGVVKTVKKFVK